MSTHHEHQLPIVPEPRQIAHLFPGYEIIGLIASGGMGVVYKARQVSLDRDVAIKLLPREFGADAEFRSSFEAEAKAMARLNHPNLISVYDFGEVDGLLFIIMELVPGKSLFHSANGTAIDPREAGRIVASVCEGLAHAHEHGILHRDVKPGNILLSPKAEPKIGDFGLARPVGKQHIPGETIFGTPGYTAPEVISHPERVDPRADIFSAGVILHELLAGKLPEDDPRPASLISGSDPRFDAIVRRATNPKPEMRYPDAAVMAREIRDLVQALTGPKLRTLAGAPPLRNLPPPRTTASLRPIVSKKSNSAMVWVVLAVLACTIGMLVLLMRNKDQPVPAKKPPGPPHSGSQTAQPPKPKPPRPTNPGSNQRPRDETAGNPGKSDPDPVASITPIPDPEPKPDPLADNTPTPDPMPEPEPEPEPTKPKLDTAAWFEMARAKMRVVAAPKLKLHDEALDRNLDSFQRGVNRALRRLDKAQRDRAEEVSDDWFDGMRAKDKRIPNQFKDAEEFFQDAREVRLLLSDEFDEALAKQQSLDQQLATEMAALANTYFLGIELRIKNLQEENDPLAIEILQAEITATRARPERFERLMRGLDPDPPKEEKPGDDKAKGKEEIKEDKEPDEAAPATKEPAIPPPPTTPG